MPCVTKTIVISAGVVLGTGAQADDRGLYGEPVPADAAFIRWIDNEIGDSRMAFGRDFTGDAIPDKTYAAISTALLDGAKAGGYYSIVATENGSAQQIREPERDEVSKVHLILLNLTDAPVSLVLSDLETEVIGATPPRHAQSRAVNPVSAALAIRSDKTGNVLDGFDVALRRGQNMTFAVIDNEVIAIPSTFGPVIAQEAN